jgi:predicted DNA-binding transcriptional regulator YafY
MRADRLLSLLMLLQARGRMTAKELARELEVSRRTVYRDISALCISGVPIYSEAGRDGGYALLDSYRTSLTGLTENEVRALFSISIPESLSELDLGRELKAALLKLSAALPDAQRQDEAHARKRVFLDSSPWSQDTSPTPHLQTVYQAVWGDQRLFITFRLPFADVELEHLVSPYGLVSKAGVWYLVYERCGIRVQRVADFLDARLSPDGFERPRNFDLPTFWMEWRATRREMSAQYRATVRVSQEIVPRLERTFGKVVDEQIAASELSSDWDWITLVLPFWSLESAREEILGFGGAMEVLGPLALRKSVEDFASQVVSLYQKHAMQEE